jgi:hypothetical protein
VAERHKTFQADYKIVFVNGSDRSEAASLLEEAGEKN